MLKPERSFFLLLVCLIGATSLTEGSPLFAQSAQEVDPESAETARIIAEVNRRERELDQHTRVLFNENKFAGSGVAGFTESQAKSHLTNHQAAIKLMQSKNMVSECRSIAALAERIGRPRNCNYLTNALQFHEDQVSWARRHIKKLQGERDQETAHQDELNKQKRENDELSDFLAKEEKAFEDTQKSDGKKADFDDFLSSYLPTTEANTANAQDDFLSEYTDVSDAAGNDGDDFLSGVTSTPDSTPDKPKEPSFKIVNNNRGQGVVDGAGNTLIPFDKWEVRQYRMGIAEVVKNIDTFVCSAAREKPRRLSRNYRAAVVVQHIGFVDQSGKFLDKPELNIYEPDSSPGLVLTSRSIPQSREEAMAQRRAAQRRKQEARRAANECRREKLDFKRRASARYD